MRKKITLLFTLIALIAVSGILIFTHWSDAMFDGERIRDLNRFALRFDRMNGTDSVTMELQEDEALHVSWQIESGYMEIVIGMEGEEAVYRANDRPAGDKADFYVEIPKTGAYTITVSAREAKGQVEFMKTENRCQSIPG